MRNPSSPLRRAIAVILSLLILPWQQPALALAAGETKVPAAAPAALDLEKPRLVLDALDVRLGALVARIKSDDKNPAAVATLPDDLVKLKGEYQAALDKYVEAEKTAVDPAKALLKPLIAASTGQLLVGAIVDNDLGGIRKDLTGLLVQEVVLSRRPDEIKPDEWAAVEKAAPDFKAGIRPLSSRVEKARGVPAFAVPEVEEGYRGMTAALDLSFQNLNGRSSKLDVNGLLAAKPATASGDAAGALMAEVARAIGPEKAALLRPQLAAVNTRLAGYLHSGNPADLTAAVGEIDRLYDAAQIKDKDTRADLFKRIGDAAQARAQQPATAAATGSAASVLTSNGIKKGTDMESMRRMDSLGLEHDDPAAPAVDAGASSIVASALAAAAALRTQISSAIPGTDAFVTDKSRLLAEQLLGRGTALKAEDALDKAEAMVQALLQRARAAGKVEDMPGAAEIAQVGPLVAAAAGAPAALKARADALQAAYAELQALPAKRLADSAAAATALVDAYALIETRVTGLVLNAPDRTADPPPLDPAQKRAYDLKWRRQVAALEADWRRIGTELNVTKDTRLGVTGDGVWGWSTALGAIKEPAPRLFAADVEKLAPARARAEKLVALFSAMTAQTAAGTLDITQWNAEFRRRILYADGQSSTADLGEFGRAFVARTQLDAGARDKGAEVMARFNARFGGMKLTGDFAADRAALDAFFDDAANAKAITEGAQLPPALAQWYAARKFDRDNAALKAAGKPEVKRPPTLATQAETYGRLVTTARLDEVHRLKEGTRRTVGELFMAQYELNRTAYLTLCPDKGELAAATSAHPTGAAGMVGRLRDHALARMDDVMGGMQAEAPNEPVAAEADAEAEDAAVANPDQAPEKPEELSGAARDAFCRGFLKAAALPAAYSTGYYDQQRRLSDGLRPYLQSLPITHAADKANKSAERMNAALRRLSPETRAELKAKGVDVDGILRQSEQGQITQWAVAVYELGITSGTAGWRDFRDSVITRFYGDHADLATGAQARELRSAADAGDPKAIGRILDGIESPSVITSGFALAVPRMLKSDRALTSARDRQILRAWNGGEEDGPPADASIAGQLLGAAADFEKDLAKPEASRPENKAAADELRRNAATIRAAVADPSDPQLLLEAMRVAGFTVYDERAARVGLDTTKAPIEPKNDEERRDLQAARMLARIFKVTEQDMRTPAGAAKIRDGLTAKLKTDVADAHEQNRRDQLLLSSQDEYRDRVAKLQTASMELLGGDAALVASAALGNHAAAADLARRMRGSASFRELAGLAGSVKSYQDDTDALTKLTFDLSRTSWGRATMNLPAAFNEAKSQTLSALYGRYAPDGLTVSGWMVGIPAGDVTRRRRYETAGVPDAPKPLAPGEQAVVGTAGRPDAPQGPPRTIRRDGITYVQRDGSTLFRSLDNSYSETRSNKVEKVTVGGVEINANVTMGFNAAGERVQLFTERNAKGEPVGSPFVLASVGSHDAAGANRVTVTRVAATNVRGAVPVETIQITHMEHGRQAVSLIERRGSETLNWTSFYQPRTKGASYDSVSMDLVGHSQSVTIGSRRTTFDLADSNAALAESRRRSTYDLSGGTTKLVETQYYSITKGADGERVVKAVVERPRTDLARPGEGTVIEIRDYRLRADNGDDTKRDGFGKPLYRNSISGLSAAQLDRAIVDRALVVDGRGDERGAPRVDFRVTLNREGKTNAQLAASYRAIGTRVAGIMDLHRDDEDKTPLSGEFGARFEKLARFFDNQFVTADAAYSVTASISRGGSVSMSGTRFDGAKLHDTNVDSPQYTFIALPKEAPKRQPGLPDKEQNGIYLQQELAGVRQAAGDEFAFVTIEPGAKGADHVTGYFGTNQGRDERNHSFRMDAFDKKVTDGNGHWYYAADIIRTYSVDGAHAGKVVADETTSMWNGGTKLGTYTSNSIRYSDWGRRNPMASALVGGIAGGFIMTMLDPTMLLMMVVPMGAGYLAAKIGPMVFKAFKLVEAGVNAYFMAQIIVHTGEGVVKVVVGVVKDDTNMVNEGGMAVGSALAMGAQMGVSHLLAGKPVGEKEAPVREPGAKPIEPAAKPAEPGAKPVEPGAKPVEPGAKPVEPGAKPVEPGPRPVEPGAKPVEPGPRPVEPGARPVEPGGRPLEPGGNHVEPNSPGRGVEPPPTPPHPALSPRMAEAPFKGSNLDAPSAGEAGGGSRGGGGGELAPGGTKSSANAGAGGGTGAAAKPFEAAAAKPAEIAPPEAPKPPAEAAKAPAEAASAPAEIAKASSAPEPGPAKPAASEAAPNRPVESAAEMLPQNPRPMERGASAGGEASAAIAEAGGRPVIERGPVERGVGEGPIEPAREGGPVETVRAREGGVEPRSPGESASPREGPAVEPAGNGAARSPEAAAGGPKPEAKGTEPGVEPAGGRTVERAPARGESAPAEASRGDVQREANALVEDGGPAEKPAPAQPGLVKRALAGADSAIGSALKPVARFVNAAASLAGRLGERKLPFTEMPLSRVVGGAVRGVQTLGLGVEAVGAKLGFLGKPIRDIGMMMQGRVLPHEGRPLTFEEVWHPDLSKRPSFLEAVSPDVLAKGGKVEGRFDPETGRATFGPRAKGGVEVAVEVRPDGKGGLEIMDYQVKASDAKLEARAHGEMYAQLERTFHTEQHQAALDDFFGNKDVTSRLARNAKPTGETFVDVTYDAGARRFRLAEPGRGEARLRLEPEPSGGLRLVEAEPLKEGGRLPPGADYNLRLFSARRGVSLEGAAPAGPKPTPEELGAMLAERLKTERVRVDGENIARDAMAEARLADAKGRLDGAETGAAAGDPAFAGVRKAARAVAELRVQRETSEGEIKAADRQLDALKIPKQTVARAEEALGTRERAGRELDRAEAEYGAARDGLDALAEGDAARPAAEKRVNDAAVRGREAASRFRSADETVATLGGELTDAGVDALVRRQAAGAKIASIEAAGRVALRDLRSEAREAGGGRTPAERKASLRETFALERVAAAEAALVKEGAIREYRRDGLDRSTGGDGRRLAMMRLLAGEGALPGGRASVGQAAGKNLCVVATAADMASAALGRPASGAMAEAEAAIIAHHQAKAKAAGAADWEASGRAEGEAFLRDAARTGMSGPEMREMMSAVAEASGLRLVEIPAENLFVELAAGRQVAIVMTHVADPVTGFKGGAHMANLSNWRLARNPGTGRMETMVDVADPNVRVLAGYEAGGAPVYDARTVSMPLSEIVPEIRGSLHGENGRVAGYAFEPASGGARAPPPSPADLALRLGAVDGVGAGRPVAGVRKPAGFDRGPARVIDASYLPENVYSAEIMEVAREHGLVFEVDAAALARMKPGVKHNFVIVENADGTIEMTAGRVTGGNGREMGVKHAALGAGRGVIFSGELVVDPATGRPQLDFNSGTYSQIGRDPRWAPTPENARSLAAHAESILGTRVEIFDHLEGRPVEFRAGREGVGSAPDAGRYAKYLTVEELHAAHKEPEIGGLYHDWQHTVKVADMAGEFAKARNLKPEDVKFVSEVALLHDFDPSRKEGMPARVPATLEALRADFNGTESLTGEAGRSILKERFGWTERQLHMAEAMIQRTEFPFGAKHPGEAYAKEGPLELYDKMLDKMRPADQSFVLREGALLSEYADKSSWYATEDFAGAFKVVEGLASEINRSIAEKNPAAPKDPMSVNNLGTHGFLSVIGEPASFELDRTLADKYGVRLDLPNRARAFAILPEHYGRTFEANLKGFGEFAAAVEAKHADAFERGRAAAETAQRTPEGVGSSSGSGPVDLARNRVRLRADAARFGRSPLDAPPPEWTAGDAGRPQAELVRAVSAEGSSGIVYEGRLGGEIVAVKTFSSPLYGQDWAGTLDYFGKEIGSYRAMEAALPKGSVPKMHGEVDVGGNPSFATELVLGKDPTSLTVAEARAIKPEAIEQAAEAVDALARRGLGGTDSPQPMILTQDQVINGVPRKAGDVVFMDAGALTADKSIWQKPASLAMDVATAREMALKALPGQESMTVDELYKALPAERLAEARASARAVSEIAAARSAARPRAAEGVGAALESPRSIVRRGATRGEGWEVDGKPATRLSGGSFKEVLIHPSDANLVIKLFSEIGSKDTASSLSEKRLEMRNLQPLLEIGRAPRVVEQGAVALETPSGGKKNVGYIIQERVAGRELGDMLRDPDPKVRARALTEARALFEDLISARIKLEDRVKMHENISVGRAGAGGPEKAWVLDAGEATRVSKPGMMDGLLGRTDPLRAYYDTVLADLSGLSRRASPALAGRAEGVGAAPEAPGSERIANESFRSFESFFPAPEGKGAIPLEAPAPQAREAYKDLPPSFRDYIEGFYRNTMEQASPRALARMSATSGADPAWWFDHGPNHGRNVVENASDLIETAQERGLIERRTGARAGTMELMTRVNAGMHDIWMQDLTQAGRPLHPARAAREAFSRGLDAAASDILAERVDGHRTLQEALVRDYGVAAADVPRVMREMMSLSYGHSKSAVPLETLDSPSLMRKTMKDVVRAQEAGKETPFESHYAPGSFDRVAYDWLETNPKLSADMIDAVRILRPADAMRWRGPNDSRSSNGSSIGVAVIDGEVTTFMRMADAESGRTYMVRFDSPISMGEANTRYTSVNAKGELTLGLDKGSFGSEANDRVMARGSAHVILDVGQDWVGSFRGVERKPIVVELPAERSPQFKKMLQDGLQEALAELRHKGKDTRLASRVVENVVFVESASGAAKAPGSRAPPAELIRYGNGKPFDPAGRRAPELLKLIGDNGVDVSALDASRAFEGARVITLAPGEELIKKGTGGEFVYVLMEGELKTVLGRGYAAHPLPKGVPTGEMAVISGNARSADVSATQASRVLAIPKATYLAEWTKAFYTHETVLGRLKSDFGAPRLPEAAAEAAPRAAPVVEGVGAGDDRGVFGRLFGGREKAPAVPERIVWPIEAGGPAPARLDFAALKLDGPLKNLEAAHTNVLAVEFGGRKAVLKVDAKPNEARVLAAMESVPLPANVRVPRLLGDAPSDAMALHRIAGDAAGSIDYAAVKRAAAEGRHMIAVERLPDDFVSMMQVTNGSVKLKSPISPKDWQGLLDAVKAFSSRGMGFGDLGNETNIRVRQVADAHGGVRTEFALIDAGQGTLKGNMDAIASDYVQLKGDRALETRLLEKGLLEGRGRLADPRLAAMARNQVPQSQKLADELSALMKGGAERPAVSVRVESRRFTDLAQAAAYLRAPDGMTLLAKTSEGLAGDTVKVEVAGQDWYLKRVTKPLGSAMDDGLRSLKPAERAGNELAMREIVRRWFPESFGVAPEAITIEHGGEIFVLTKGAAAAPDPARIARMTAAQRADYALLRLVFRAEDLNRGNILFGKDGKPTLIDFEKVIAEPLDPAAVARGADNEIFVKGFPVVSLAGNDPAIYRAHADKLRERFDDPNFVARLTEVLVKAGWTPERTAAYLKAVEINLKNFEINVAPYINAANKVAAKRARPEGVGSGHEEIPPFLRKASADPQLEPVIPTVKAPPVLTEERLNRHLLSFELTPSANKIYTPPLIVGGGHTQVALDGLLPAIKADLVVKRARYAADIARIEELSRLDPASRDLRKLKRTVGSYEAPPALGTHWSETPGAIRELPEYPNGVKRVVLPAAAFTKRALFGMEVMSHWLPGYEVGGKTLFPDKWTAADISSATGEVIEHGTVVKSDAESGAIKRLVVERHGQKVSIDTSLDAAGGVSSSYPSWNQ